MRRLVYAVAVIVLVAAWPVFAQERAGAGRFELSAIPVGGVFFGSSSSGTEPDFGNYTVAGAAGWNFNKWFGVEGEIGHAVGVKQALTFNGETLGAQASPSLFAYSGNALFNPLGNERSFVPYATGGVGGLRMLQTDDVRTLGITAPTNFLTGNLGGGVKWFAGRHWGLRGDYRLIIVNNNTNAPEFFGREEIRYGHRMYGALLLTY